MADRETNNTTASEKVAFNNMTGYLPTHNGVKIDHNKCRYPHCIVWTPIPCLTWLFPFIGHMGIATSAGVIRDFAGPYYVSEDDMAFGRPTKYWQLDLLNVPKGKEKWDKSVAEASEEYKHRMHNLCCDNCHSHVAMALNLMNYNNKSSYNMVVLCFLMLIYGKYVSFCGFLKTWLPFLIMASVITIVSVLSTHM
ncbi:transmembrane protein 222-like [Ostrea edulis]|uniref:transmembrane protein 222-like n=1 Tax=Ostrea edulis TaxID=37623 RepID=UPI00209600F3|nr:transmembrane protein 222-like [Ostrea edulis]